MEQIKNTEKVGNQLIYQWYSDCIYELEQYFGIIDFDDIRLNWVLIQDYPLPDTFLQTESSLLLGTPSVNIENHNGYDFFMDLDLSRMDGQQTKHLIDRRGYNPHRDLGYCRLSYHLQKFNPAYPIKKGDTLLDICQSLFHFLGQKW